MKQVFFISVIFLICSNGYSQVAAPIDIGRISSIEEFHARFPFSDGNVIELVGWSSTGLVAYLNHLKNTHSGQIIIDLVIFDARRNVIIDRVGIGYALFLEGYNSPIFIGAGCPEEVIIATLRNWNETLERNGISGRIHNFNTLLNFTPFHSFPLIQREETFDSWFEIVAEEAEDSFTINFTWSLIGSNGAQTKMISTGQATNNSHGYVGSTVLGYYKSPYENILVVIIAHLDRTLGNNAHRIMLYGFYLDGGFN